MNLLIINPNSTSAMTSLIESEARAVAAADTRILAVNPLHSPAAIQGPTDGDNALPHVVELFEFMLERESIDAAIVACFDDTGLQVLKPDYGIPVLGIGEAAFHIAMLRAARFSVVTTLPISIPVIERNITHYGFVAQCDRVYAADVGVLEIESDSNVAMEKICLAVEKALAEHQSDAIVLGCAGMADLAVEIEQRYKVPVIDGVKSAVVLAEAVVRSASH